LPTLHGLLNQNIRIIGVYWLQHSELCNGFQHLLMSSKPGVPPAPKAQEKVQELVDAIRRADASLVSTLIELEGPRIVKGPDPSGVLPLVAAAELGHVGILRMCLVGANCL
jgi:hypothetical protein